MPKLLRRWLIGSVVMTALVVLGWAGVSGAQELDPVTELATATNLLWVVLGAVLVIFMQAGFALVETGFCRAKHSAHVMSTNFAIFGIAFVGYFLVGFPLMFGGFSYPGVFGLDEPIGGALIGSGSWVFLWEGGFALSGITATPAVMGFFLYMVAFMDTVATIPTGAMAERWKWKSFVIWGFFCGAIYYPLFGAWTWGGGWLSQLGNSQNLGLGYVDFAGSGVVHAVGGAAALAGCLVLGPRIGKYGPNGEPRTLAAHSIPLAMLGCFILLFGWFGFNAASTFSVVDIQFATVAANTAIAAAFGAVAGMFWIWFRSGKPDPGMMVNGMLAGLVAITAPCAFVLPWAAAVIGILAAVIVIEACAFFEKKGIDDPVGAIGVHGVGGIFGVLCVGIFSSGDYGAGWNLTESNVSGVTGILYGGDGWGQLGAQAAGALVICTVIFGIAFAFFKIQNALTKGGIRPTAEVEMEGVDMPEMGVLGYVYAEHHTESEVGVEEPITHPTP
jgi:Amt family ammonium transporter